MHLYLEVCCLSADITFLFLVDNFIYLWLCWVFVVLQSLTAASRGYCLVAVCGLLIAVASLVAEQGLRGVQASVVATPGLKICSSQTLEHKLSSCSIQA